MPTLNVMDYIDRRFWGAIENHRFETDITASLDRAVEALPTAGGKILAPAGRYPTAGWRVDGSGGTKRGVQVLGDGEATHFIKPPDSTLTTAAKKRANVIEALSGGGFVLSDFKVEGNRSRGGVSPPYGAIWSTSTTYTAGSATTYTTLADGTAYTSGNRSVLAFANGGRMFRVAQTHTSHGSDIDNDVPANMTEVTNQQWDEVAQTGYLGHWDDDADYQYRHGLYLHGEASAITDCLVMNVEALDCVYGGIVIGSGPIFATGFGAGSARATTINCYSHSNGGSNFGGGWNTFCRHIAPRSVGGLSSGVRFDENSDDSMMICPIVQTGAGLTNSGIYVYKSDRCKIIAPMVRDTTAAITIQECLLYELIAPDVNGQTITISSSTASGADMTDALTVMSRTAIPAGGTAGKGVKFSTTSNFGVFFGSGAPTLSAAKGSLYLRSDGSGTGDRAYINTNGSTTWTALTTAA